MTERENVTKFLGVLTLNFFVSYKSRGIVKQPLLKQFYFSFIHCHLNYVNIAWASTCKSKLEGIYHHQKHAAHIINSKRIDLPMPNHYFMTWKPTSFK